jgi:hypothetical protein
MAVEIVDLPSYKMVMFHSFLLVYQRVKSTRNRNIMGILVGYKSEFSAAVS